MSTFLRDPRVDLTLSHQILYPSLWPVNRIPSDITNLFSLIGSNFLVKLTINGLSLSVNALIWQVLTKLEVLSSVNFSQTPPLLLKNNWELHQRPRDQSSLLIIQMTSELIFLTSPSPCNFGFFHVHSVTSPDGYSRWIKMRSNGYLCSYR